MTQSSKPNMSVDSCQRFHLHGCVFVVMSLFVFAMKPQTGTSSVPFSVSCKLTPSCHCHEASNTHVIISLPSVIHFHVKLCLVFQAHYRHVILFPLSSKLTSSCVCHEASNTHVILFPVSCKLTSSCVCCFRLITETMGR